MIKAARLDIDASLPTTGILAHLRARYRRLWKAAPSSTISIGPGAVSSSARLKTSTRPGIPSHPARRPGRSVHHRVRGWAERRGPARLRPQLRFPTYRTDAGRSAASGSVRTLAPDIPGQVRLTLSLGGPASAKRACTQQRQHGRRHGQEDRVFPAAADCRNPSHCRSARSTRRTAAPPRCAATQRPRDQQHARGDLRKWSRDRPASRRNRSWRRTAPCPAA